MSRYEQFDRSRLLIQPLAERRHDLQLDHWLALSDPTPPFEHADLATVAARLAAARQAGAARILMMGAHVLRSGVSRHIIDLVERGSIDHLAMNGAGAIHDYELARCGATTESVDRYIRTGEFGLWRETGELNDWIREAAGESLGLGENAGRRIDTSGYPHRDLSVFAAAWRAGVPWRALKGKTCKVERPASSTSFSVFSNISSVSVGKPAIRSAPSELTRSTMACK